MPGQGFDINITSSEVLVKQDGSLQSGTSRGAAGALCIFAALLSLARLLLEMARTLSIGSHDSVEFWHQITVLPKLSSFLGITLLLESGLAIFIGYLFLIGVRLFFPAGEQLQCDRTTFTYSKIPSVSLGGRWKRRSFAVADVSELMYGVIIPGDPEKKTEDQYGLSFYVGDKEYKIFAGLEAPDADKIVKQLRAFGMDVIVNQYMTKMVNETLQEHDSMSKSY